MKLEPTWELLRALGSARFARFSIFVPVFGYLIIFNDAFAALLQSSMDWACFAFDSEICEEDHLASLQPDFMLRRVIELYLALSVVAFGTLVFQVFCPHEINKYWHAETYVAANTKIFHPEFNFRIHDALKSIESSEADRIQATFDKYKEFDRPKASEMYDRDILSLWFKVQNHKFSVARWLTAAAFLIGIALLAYPTINVFFRVAAIVLRI